MREEGASPKGVQVCWRDLVAGHNIATDINASERNLRINDVGPLPIIGAVRLAYLARGVRCRYTLVIVRLNNLLVAKAIFCQCGALRDPRAPSTAQT